MIDLDACVEEAKALGRDVIPSLKVVIGIYENSRRIVEARGLTLFVKMAQDIIDALSGTLAQLEGR